MKKKSYIFFYNDSTGTQEHVKNVIDRMSYVDTWRYDMHNIFYLVSSATADEIAKQFEDINGDKGRYIFVEYTSNVQGQLLKKSWFLLNNKRHKRDS